MHLLGVMSGTSLDGIDFCYIEMDATTYDFNIISAETYPYPKHWEKILKSASTKSEIEVEEINVSYTQYLNEQIHQFIRLKNIKALDLVASHGHTIWHKPSEGFTLQIGNKLALSKGFNIPVVNDIVIPNTYLVKYKEALIFVLLGLLKWQGKNNVLSSVTGAKYDHSSGMIYH